MNGEDEETKTEKDLDESISLKTEDEIEEDANVEVSAEKVSKSSENDPKIKRLRHYLRLAGLRIVKNSELDQLKSKKAKYEFLKKIFVDAGYKGTSLSIKNCQKFKLKKERQKEIAELDVTNIIESNATQISGRTRLTRNSIRNSTKVSEENRAKIPHVRLKKLNIELDSDKDEDEQENTENRAFSGIRDLIESDDSGSDEGKSKMKYSSSSNRSPSQMTKKIVDSGDEE